MINLIQARIPDHKEIVRQLLAEYLAWVCDTVREQYNVALDVGPMIDHDMETMEVFLPPKGILLLAFDDESPAGCAGARTIGEGVAEIKRMFVRPNHRRKGIGAKLASELIRQIRSWGYKTIRLDSAEFMSDAHRVYRSHGFVEIPPYDESEVPAQYRKQWIFMQLELKHP